MLLRKCALKEEWQRGEGGKVGGEQQRPDFVSSGSQSIQRLPERGHERERTWQRQQYLAVGQAYRLTFLSMVSPFFTKLSLFVEFLGQCLLLEVKSLNSLLTCLSEAFAP